MAIDIARLLAAERAKKAALALVTTASSNTSNTNQYGTTITYNSKQQAFIDLAASGKSCVLLGAAGTGKTTCTQGAIKALIQSGTIPPLDAGDHKHLKSGTPGIVIISFTRRAVNNIRKVQSQDMKDNCITAHKLLEYGPVPYTITDAETGATINTMRFLPARTELNPLPRSIHTIVIEEASMFSEELFQLLIAALPHKVQFIFIGDIQQLPPVMGKAILGYKILQLPVVELTEVYRQALDSPIIKLAHRILSGKYIPATEYPEWDSPKLRLHPWKKKLQIEDTNKTLAAFFKQQLEQQLYDPEEDMILIPYGKPGCVSTAELNAHIANMLARRRNAVTHEIIAGYSTYYLSEGDKVLYDKEEGEIVSIAINMSYTGKRPQKASVTLDYWGHNSNPLETHQSAFDPNLDIDALLTKLSAQEEDKVNQASHVITIYLREADTHVSISKSAEVNNLLHGYALTVHKSQGSEWRKVYLAFHHTHAKHLCREMLYTAVTRAREHLYVICEPDTFTKGIVRQRIKGNTLAEKAEYFKGKLGED